MVKTFWSVYTDYRDLGTHHTKVDDKKPRELGNDVGRESDVAARGYFKVEKLM